ncbi:putative glycoside hydrolase [Marinimicrobium agarilyticum]|uniref:putative glycoside hydrolase n=1 Tax=Marinimicrobium agarilyticum TaxID=306546 RepID=UPI0003F7CE01|nr:putative glycoside hydrolase [Marinimicrobium agarilyticum]
MLSKLNILSGCFSLLILAGCGGGGGPGTGAPDVQKPAPENRLPTANAGMTATVMGGTVIELDGSGSVDADGDELTYDWTVEAAAAYFVAEDGSLTEPLESATGKLLIPASEAGNDIIVSLEVSDGIDTATDVVTYSVQVCADRQGYVFTDCIDPTWQGSMAWDVNFLDVTENFGYYGGDTGNHVRWSLVDVNDDQRGNVLDVTFNKENWNGSFRIVPSGRAIEPNTSVDLGIYEDGSLVFDIRVVNPADADIFVTAECIYPCEAIPRQVLTSKDGSWSTVSIPLAEFSMMNWSKTSVPFAIYPEWGAQTDVHLQVDNIRFESPSCVEADNVIFGDCLGPMWYTVAAVDDGTTNDLGNVYEYRSGNSDNHVQWSEQFSGSADRGDILSVKFTSDATNGHFYVRTETTETSNDMSAYLNGALVFDLNVQSYGSNTDGLIVRVDTWWDGETSDEILLENFPVGEWATVEIPVSDLLVGGGLDLSDVHAGFSIWPAGHDPGDQEGVEVLLDNIRWERQLSE